MFYLAIFILYLQLCVIKGQTGPDPWNYDTTIQHENIEHDVPPDIRMNLKKPIVTENKLTAGICEWSFKRMLSLMLKAGQIQEDGNVVVSLQFKFNQNHWKIMNEYVKSGDSLTEDRFRRTLGYLEEAIYKPSITEKIIMAWSDYVQIYISEYKIYITWTLGILATLFGAIWMWNHISHRHIFIILIILLYIYEIFVSYKEAEKEEYQRFVNALNSCKWYFLSSNCEIPAPDLLTFLKHMNPTKVAMRMFTTVISEPMVTVSSVVKPIINDITGGLWWPFDKIMYGVITLFINILIIVLFIFIISNFIFNIPMNLSFGLIGVALKERRRFMFSSNHPKESDNDHTQRASDNLSNISNTTLDKILDVCSQALAIQNKVTHKPHLNAESDTRENNDQFNFHNNRAMKRSSSTGRLPSSTTFENNNRVVSNIYQRKKYLFEKGGGRGDVS